MEKRVLLAVVLCLATLFVWYWLFPPPPPTPGTAGPPPGQQNKITEARPASPQLGGSVPAAPVAAAPVAAAPVAAAPVAFAPVAPEQRTVIERPGLYRAVVTSHGAALASYELLNPKHFTRDMRRMVLPPGKSQPERDVRQTDGPTQLVASYKSSLGVRFPKSGFKVPEEVRDQAWALVENVPLPDQGQRVVYQIATPEVRLQKTLVFSGRSHQIQVSVEVTNLLTSPVSHHFEIGLEGYQDPAQKPGGMFSARVPQNEGAWDKSGKLGNATLEDLQNRVPLEKLRGDLRWIAVNQQYFILAAALPHGQEVGEKQGRASAEGNGAISLSAEYSEKMLSPGASAIYPITVYAGPKLPELLDEVSVSGQAAGLTTSINFQTLPVLGWVAEPLVRPLLWVLRQLHAFFGSWALAIVLLTVLVKLITLYPTHKSMKSMKAMSDLRPDIEALKLKCGDDKQKFNVEMMALYKKHGINPLGGCLPMLVQMPIWIALYSMLSSAVELYREPFLTPRWIADLTLADPYFVLPLFTGGLMYLQTRLSPPPTDPQQKMMANMMPIMFTFFSLFLPAGLTIYILTNTVLGMIQQLVINRGKPSIKLRPSAK